jgi:hypothetical protein
MLRQWLLSNQPPWFGWRRTVQHALQRSHGIKVSWL